MLDNFDARQEAIQTEAESLHARIEEVRTRPFVAGDAVDRLVTQTMDDIARDTELLRVRIEDLERDVHESVFDRPRNVGWLGRQGACFGLFVGLLAPTVFLWSVVTGWNVQHINARYYEIAAQVIPVLVLAAAIEGRPFKSIHGAAVWTRWQLSLSFIWMIVGEWAAMDAVIDGGTDLTFGLTVTAMMLASSVIAAQALDVN